MPCVVQPLRCDGAVHTKPSSVIHPSGKTVSVSLGMVCQDLPTGPYPTTATVRRVVFPNGKCRSPASMREVLPLYPSSTAGRLRVSISANVGETQWADSSLLPRPLRRSPSATPKSRPAQFDELIAFNAFVKQQITSNATYK